MMCPPCLALTALVFPGYFRARTIALGRYIGIFVDEDLVAMGGERLLLTGHCELSAICTHPAHVGHGYARAIMRELCATIADRGFTPFLHVSPENTRARALYRSLGFAEHAFVPLMRATGPGPRRTEE